MSNESGSSYLKVPKVSSKLFTGDRLYYNGQHILVVESGYFQETYRKIAFVDVCGLSICESKRQMAWGIVYVAISVIFGIFSVTTDFEVPALIVLLGLALAALGLNIAKGKSVHCVLSTAYSDVPLKTATRMKKAFLFKEFLDEKVSAAQGLLSGEQAREIIESKAGTSLQPETVVSGPQVAQSRGVDLPDDALGEMSGEQIPAQNLDSNTSPPPLPLAKGLSKRHWAFSVALGILGLSCLGNYFFHWYSGLITGLLFAASMMVSIFATTRKIGSDAGEALGKVFVGAIAFHFIAAIGGYFILMWSTYSDPIAYQNNPLQPYQMESPVANLLFLVTGIVALGFAFIAAFQMLRIKN